MKDRYKGGRSLVEHKANCITKKDWKHFFSTFDSKTHCSVRNFQSTIVHKMPAAICTLLHSVPAAAGIFHHPTTPFITYSICPFAYMLISFDKANLCNLNQWNNHWLGLKAEQYGSVTFLCRPRGLFVMHGAQVPPPFPLMPRQGLMGTSVISSSGRVNTNRAVYYRNLLCWLWPLPRVRAMAFPASAAWG